MAGLSVLIPVFNRPVAALVTALLAQAPHWPGPVEICLLDDGSAPEYQALNQPLAGWPGVVYAELPRNVGRAAVRNQLAARARYEWLLLLDNDQRCCPTMASFWRATRQARARAASVHGALLAGWHVRGRSRPPTPALYLRWHYGRAARNAAPPTAASGATLMRAAHQSIMPC